MRVGVCLVEAPAEDAAGDDDARPATSKPPPFLPAGLARDLRPFAVTLHRASNLPDVPASHVELDELCEPIAAHLAWRHPKTKESVWPKTDDDDDDAPTRGWYRGAPRRPRRVANRPTAGNQRAVQDEGRAVRLVLNVHERFGNQPARRGASTPLELRIDRVRRAVRRVPGLDKLEGNEDGMPPRVPRVPREAGKTRRFVRRRRVPRRRRTPERFSTEKRVQWPRTQTNFTSRLTWTASARCPGEVWGRRWTGRAAPDGRRGARDGDDDV